MNISNYFLGKNALVLFIISIISLPALGQETSLEQTSTRWSFDIQESSPLFFKLRSSTNERDIFDPLTSNPFKFDPSFIDDEQIEEIIRSQNNNCSTELSDISNALHLEILEFLKNNQEQRIKYLLNHPESDSSQIYAYRKAILEQIIQFSSE